ncbi:MAG: hypothetical protein AB7G13_01950 [Lautropia sp.]
MSAIRKDTSPGLPLAGFPLAWRWLEPGPHRLPPAALARLQVLPVEQARAVFGHSCALLRGDGLDDGRFALRTATGSRRDVEQVARWLRTQQRCMSATVFLSWEPELALCSRWSVFAHHWRAFCQPGSDDLVVFPPSQRWAAFYHHADRLQFGVRRDLQQSFRSA